MNLSSYLVFTLTPRKPGRRVSLGECAPGSSCFSTSYLELDTALQLLLILISVKRVSGAQ